MEWRLIFMALICLCIAQLAFADKDNYPFQQANEQQRFVQLTKEIRCAACQNQTLFDSNSSFAADMRAQIYKMFNSGMTDKQIRDHLSYSYGDFILLTPPWRFGTLLLWIGPIMMLLMAVVSYFRFLGQGYK